MMLTTPAEPQPATRSGTFDSEPGSVTGRTNASSNEVDELASTELTTPEKSTKNPTTTIDAVASQMVRLASVPRQTSTAPTTTSATWACTRSAIVPV